MKHLHMPDYKAGVCAAFARGNIGKAKALAENEDFEHIKDLKKGLTLNLNGTPYKSENGLLDLINENMSETPFYEPIHISGEDIEIVITHGSNYGENITSFVNGQNTRDGGTHLAAVREAVSKTLKEFFKVNSKKDFAPEDIRQGIIGAISIQIQEPIFANQAKTKLGSTYMQAPWHPTGK